MQVLVEILSALGAIGFAGIVIGCAVVWWRRTHPRHDPYDLKLLFSDPPEPVGEAYDDMVTEESGPYCVSCDEPFPPGTSICLHCGRPLG
jgi:hypothetical protein